MKKNISIAAISIMLMPSLCLARDNSSIAYVTLKNTQSSDVVVTITEVMYTGRGPPRGSRNEDNLSCGAGFPYEQDC